MSAATGDNREPARPGDAVVITGAALITSLGLDRETTWRAVRQGLPVTTSLKALLTAAVLSARIVTDSARDS